MKNNCMRVGVNILGEKLSLSLSEKMDGERCRLLVYSRFDNFIMSFS
jgi:hypothetical protein